MKTIIQQSTKTFKNLQTAAEACQQKILSNGAKYLI
jgi:hypothetical protein